GPTLEPEVTVMETDADRPVVKHIERLVHEEHRLYEQGKLSDADRQRLQQGEVELDQCWDLLRQRRGPRGVGQEPPKAPGVRPGSVRNNEQSAGGGRGAGGVGAGGSESCRGRPVAAPRS